MEVFMSDAEDKALRAVITVGDGRGFLIEGRHDKLVVTAAHCLGQIELWTKPAADAEPRVMTNLPPAHSMSYLEERTYRDLLAPLGDKPRVWAECLFVDPIADIALLGPPDGQELSDEYDRYMALIEEREPLAISPPPLREKITLRPFGDADPGVDLGVGSTHARLLSLDNKWFDCVVEHRGGPLWIKEAQIVGGMSGSPILAMDGGVIGLVNINGGGACLMHHLPGWILASLRICGGSLGRRKERKMSEQMREYLDLKNKIKGWFVDNLGRKDDENLDDMVDEIAFAHLKPMSETPNLNEILARWDLSNLPASLAVDLEKLGEMENAIGTEQMMEWEEAQKNERLTR
jgi:hypothetical protein